jgi:hypothetical protein
VAYLLRLVHCLATTNQPDTPLLFNSSNTTFGYNSAGTPATLKALVTFEAGKTYYFIYDSTGGWPFPVATGVWIEDDEGNVIAGKKVKAFGRH